MTVFITGLNGFIARHLAHWLSDRGHAVRGTSRSAGPQQDRIAWTMGDPIAPAAFDGVDVVVHAAHDFTPGARDVNVGGTLAAEGAARAAGVARQILVSSLSARPDATSEYGRTKLAQEARFTAEGHTIVRPGTVLGRGGLFGKMAGAMERFPALPLIDGGRAPMTVIGVHDLCRAFEAILDRPAGEYNLYYPSMPTLGELFRELRAVMDRRVLLIPVPAKLLILPLSILRTLGIRAPVDIDNLKGYMTNVAPHHRTHLPEVLPRPSTVRDALAEAWLEAVPGVDSGRRRSRSA